MKSFFSSKRKKAISNQESPQSLDISSTNPSTLNPDFFPANQSATRSPPLFVRPTPTYGTPVHSNNPYPTPPSTASTSQFGVSSSPPNRFQSTSPPSSGMSYNSTPNRRFSSMMNSNESSYSSKPYFMTEDMSSDLLNENKLSIGLDFGTTFSGVAYGSNRLREGQVRQILNWPGSIETYRKIPTCLVYQQHSHLEAAELISWGIQAKSSPLVEGMIKVEYFKLFLDPVRDGRNPFSVRLPDLPHGKTAFDVISDYLGCLWKYAKERIRDELGSVVDLESADVVLTVPSAWDAVACSIMRDAAIRAGLVQSSRGGDTNWRDRLRIITEPEAAAIHASTLSTLHQLRPSQSFVIADLGGGTCDCAAYKLIGQMSQLEIAEMCARSGANCGSLFLDLRFEALIRHLLRDHPAHLDRASIAAFRHAFAETDKLAYLGEQDDETLFRFNCFNTEDDFDESVGLEYGELAIPGAVLRRDVFDPVVAKTPNINVNALILVGGFASSEYLFTRIRQIFGSRIPFIGRPKDCDVATLQGAARFGLSLTGGKVNVSSVICPRSYIMKVKLPAEPMDQYQRPGYISTNKAGIEICANRLSYLVAKGAVLRKGQRLRSRFCKYSKGPNDSIFTALLYVSDADQIYRYTDEGEIMELCRWTVDLAPLSEFKFNALNNNPAGFYTEFDLGLELDSAEVRGVLLNDRGEECGRATFEFISTV